MGRGRIQTIGMRRVMTIDVDKTRVEEGIIDFDNF